MSEKRVLVTGGAGFIGSHIAEVFVDRGWACHILDNLSTGRAENVPASAILHRVDITTPALDLVVNEIRPQVLVVVLLLSVRAINSVGLNLAITAGGPVRATNTLSFFLYQEAWKFGDFSSGAAIAVIMFMLNLVIAVLYLRTLRVEA